MLETAWIRWIVYACILVGGFFATLWMLGPPRHGDGITKSSSQQPAGSLKLESSNVLDRATLAAAAMAAGLRASAQVQGHLDELKRLNGSDVAVQGWSAYRFSKGLPITIVAFVDGRYMFKTESKGERPDVTAALGLRDSAAANVAFAGAFPCRSNQSLLMLAIAEDGSYFGFEPIVCP